MFRFRIFVLLLSLFHPRAFSQDTKQLTYKLLGTIQPKNANEISGSNWLIGCEVLDRDFADYDAYKEYLVPLGIKRIRLQAGWAKTEKVKGKYDWQWLDHIINDATSRGLEPWLQTSYGNPIYPGGGGVHLSAGAPTSPEALAAWDRWVESMAKRYKGKVKLWEVWNEPNFGDNEFNTPQQIAMLNIRTSKIIKRIQPEAEISGLSMGHINLDYAKAFFDVLKQKKAFNLFHNITYHDYVYNPDANQEHVNDLKRLLHQYSPKTKLRQGENGCPSEGGLGGAIGEYNWTELSQAKWISRRMLNNLGHDIECSIFTIIDIAYKPTPGNPISRLNVKGLIQSDMSQKALRPKLSYGTVQTIASIFTDSLERIKNFSYTFNPKATVPAGSVQYIRGTDKSLAVYGYRHKASGKHVFTIWSDESIPQNINEYKELNMVFLNSELNEPVYIDLISGKVYEIPPHLWKRNNNTISFSKLPVYDGPIAIADKSVVQISKAR